MTDLERFQIQLKKLRFELMAQQEITDSAIEILDEASKIAEKMPKEQRAVLLEASRSFFKTGPHQLVP